MSDESTQLRDDDYAPVPSKESAENMVRTQIYLSRAEHEFLQREAQKHGKPMAALIRSYIDEKINMPAAAWESNPLLEPTPEDPLFQGRPDSSLNHDHYAYGAPKAYAKRGSKWVLKQ
jgi:hypothetical protein